jgi:hypothetical protein
LRISLSWHRLSALYSAPSGDRVTRAPVDAAGVKGAWPIFLFMLFGTAAVAALQQFAVLRPNHDVSWMLIAAARLIDGGAYVKDIYEVNAPLAVFIYCPGALLAKWFGLDPWTAFLIASYALIAASLLASGVLLARLFPERPGLAGALLLVAAIIFLILPGFEFGQREHYAVILFLPYAIAAALEDSVGPVRPRSLMVGICLAAAVGALIKPFFVLLPAAIFVSRIIQTRSLLAALRRIDVATFVVAGLGYLLLLLVIYPGWMQIMLATVTLYQDLYSHPRFTLGIAVLGGGTAGILIVSGWLTVRSRAEIVLTRYTALLAVAAVAIFALQEKGWKYQYFPLVAFVLFSSAVFILGSLSEPIPAGAIGRRTRWSIAAAGLLLVAMLLPHSEPAWSKLDYYKRLPVYAETERMAPGRPVLVISAGLSAAFPWVLMQNRVWPSRFPSMWLLKSIDSALSHTANRARREKLSTLRQQIAGMLLEDIERYRPALVLVDINTADRFSNGSFSYLAYFQSAPSFAAIREKYRRTGQVDHFAIFSPR